MGLKNEPSHRHTVLGNVRVVQQGADSTYEVEVPVLDEYQARLYNDGLVKARRFNNRFLYLPTSSNYQNGPGYLCGQAGTMKLQY
jgi:hypothetical protein